MRLVGTDADITERRVAEEALHQAQRTEVVGQLAAGIAHDFNNLLTVILANAELAAQDLPLDAKDVRASLDEVKGSALKGGQLVHKLLAYTRQEMLTFKPVDLPALVTAAITTLRRLLPETITIRHASDDSLPAVYSDPGAVDQMLMNLATNARDAMPGGGVLRIETQRATFDPDHQTIHGWGEPGEYVCLSVSDTGTGMDEATRQRVFEPFFTTKPVGKGTGLGMATVYGMMKQHRGFVDVVSEPGRGTSVKLLFPQAIGEGGPSVRAETAAARASGAETLVVVEDEETIRRAVKRVLEREGYTVLLAADGQEALELVRAHGAEVRLVITDVVMPRMTGHRLHELMRHEAPTTPVLFTSGYAAGTEELCGVDQDRSFLAKPWTVAELLGRVREVLDQGGGGDEGAPDGLVQP